jgi:hypothetical protein
MKYVVVEAVCIGGKDFFKGDTVELEPKGKDVAYLVGQGKIKEAQAEKPKKASK